MPSVIYIVLGVFVFFYLKLSIQFGLRMRKLGGVYDGVDVLENGVAALEESPEYRVPRLWADQNGFKPHEVTDIFSAGGRATTGTWKHPESKCRFHVVFIAKEGYDAPEFQTFLGESGGLSTTKLSRAAIIPPVPGRYVQVFPSADIDELYTRHVAALEHLEKRFGLRPVDRDLPSDVLAKESFKQFYDHVRSHFLWPFRYPYWHFVRCRWMTNRSIARQYPAGG